MHLTRNYTEGALPIAVSIYGTCNEPRFVAQQIGNILGIPTLSEVLAGFDKDEVELVRITPTDGNEERAEWHLTEAGVMRLARIARESPFPKWLVKTLSELRKMEVESLLAEKRARTPKQITKTTKPTHLLYVLMNPADGERSLYKMGRTQDIKKRKNSYNTALPDGANILHTVMCIDSVVCERAAANLLAPFRYRSEWYQCDLALIITAMEAAVIVNDGLMQCVEYMHRDNFIDTLKKNFEWMLTENETFSVQPMAQVYSQPDAQADQMAMETEKASNDHEEEDPIISFLQSEHVRYRRNALTRMEDLRKRFEEVHDTVRARIARNIITSVDGRWKIKALKTCRGCKAVLGTHCCSLYDGKKQRHRTTNAVILGMELVGAEAESG